MGKKKPLIKKKDGQIKHAKRRFLERHGRPLDNCEYKELILLIKSGKTRFTCKLSNRVSMKELYYKGELIHLIFDHNRNTIVSFIKYSDSKIKKLKDKEFNRRKEKIERFCNRKSGKMIVYEKQPKKFDVLDTEFVQEMERETCVQFIQKEEIS